MRPDDDARIRGDESVLRLHVGLRATDGPVKPRLAERQSSQPLDLIPSKLARSSAWDLGSWKRRRSPSPEPEASSSSGQIFLDVGVLDHGSQRLLGIAPRLQDSPGK